MQIFFSFSFTYLFHLCNKIKKQKKNHQKNKTANSKGANSIGVGRCKEIRTKKIKKKKMMASMNVVSMWTKQNNRTVKNSGVRIIKNRGEKKYGKENQNLRL